jgi:hypothetical protein
VGSLAQQTQVKGDLFDKARCFEPVRPLVTPGCAQPQQAKVRERAREAIELPAYQAMGRAESHPFPALWFGSQELAAARGAFEREDIGRVGHYLAVSYRRYDFVLVYCGNSGIGPKRAHG